MTDKTELAAQIDAFEHHYHYDTTYMRELLDSSLDAYQAFGQSSALSQFREKLSKDEHWLCKLAAMQAEDCGACLQLTLDMALEDGFAPAYAQAVLNQGQGLPAALFDLFGFATDVAANRHDYPEQTQRVHARYSKAELLEMGLAIASVKLYPSIKRALGYAKRCQLMTFRVAS